jgi:hypothetical protein
MLILSKIKQFQGGLSGTKGDIWLFQLERYPRPNTVYITVEARQGAQETLQTLILNRLQNCHREPPSAKPVPSTNKIARALH